MMRKYNSFKSRIKRRTHWLYNGVGVYFSDSRKLYRVERSLELRYCPVENYNQLIFYLSIFDFPQFIVARKKRNRYRFCTWIALYTLGNKIKHKLKRKHNFNYIFKHTLIIINYSAHYKFLYLCFE